MANSFSDPELPRSRAEGGELRGRTREVNTVEPSPERGRKRLSAERKGALEPEGDERTGPSRALGDIPDALGRRYFHEAVRGGAALAFYDGPGARRVAFHDHGGRLSSEAPNPAVVRDLAAIAAHRGWTTIQVRGEDEFRREMWMEARALGLQVRGYKPRERDEQELQQRLATPSRRAAQPSQTSSAREAPGEPPASPPPSRADFDKGVDGRLVASGEAPYRRRSGEAPTPFIRIDPGDGKPIDVWGVGLPDALLRAGAALGDQIRVRRDGVDSVQKSLDVRDPKTGELTRQLRDLPRNRWEIEAERFRQSSPAEAARDPDLKGAQSHLAVVDPIIDRKIADPQSRSRLHAEARALVAGELAEGRRFEPAQVREVEPVLARDIAEAAQRDRDGPERALRR